MRKLGRENLEDRQTIKIDSQFGKANEEELYGVEFAHRVNAR